MTNVDLIDRDVFGYAVDKGWMCPSILCQTRKINRT